MLPIETMNWTKLRTYPILSHEQIVILTTPGPSEHPHSALLPTKFHIRGAGSRRVFIPSQRTNAGETPAPQAKAPVLGRGLLN